MVDNFMISQMKTCPRKYYWRVVRSLVNVVKPAFAPTFGIAVHKGCEAMYRGGDLMAVREAFLRSYLPFWQQFGNPEVTRTPELGCEIMDGFYHQFNDDPFQTIPECLEIGFALELAPEVMYCGRIDRMVMLNDEVNVLDWKTSSMPWLFCERPNDQGTGYVWAAGELQDMPVKGVIFDVIHTRATSLKSQKEGVPKWLTDRRISGRQEWEIEKWKNTTLFYVGQVQRCMESGDWPDNSEACISYNQPCPYIDLCNTEERYRDGIIRTDFEVSPWEPYEGAMDGVEGE